MSANDYQNYFKNQAQIEPLIHERFQPCQVKQLLQTTLNQELENFILDDNNIQEKTSTLTTLIRDKVQRNLNIPRYKIIVQVVMGALDNRGIRVTSKCLWDINSDNYSSYTYENENYFCTVMVFGLFNE